MKFDLQGWLKAFCVWLLALMTNLSYWFGEVGRKLISISPLLDAIIKLLMALILFAYFLKVFFGVKIPVFLPIVERVKKFVGVRDKQMKAISMIDSEMESIEDTIEKTRTMSITLFVLLKKGYELMRKLIVAIGKFFYRNKFTILGAISLLIIATSVYFRITKPELVHGFIGDKEFFGALVGLFSYSMFSLFGYGIENQDAWNKRHQEKWARDEVEEELKKRTKEELRKNKIIKTTIKEIEKNIVPLLKERIRQAAIIGIQSNYASIVKQFPELNFEIIKAELGNDENRINDFLTLIDDLAEQTGLLEEVSAVRTINGVKQEVKEYINLILEEIQK